MNDEETKFDEVPESLSNDLSLAMQRKIPRQPDGRPTTAMVLPSKDEYVAGAAPGELIVLEVDSQEDATRNVEKAVRAGYSIAREEDLEGVGPVPLVKVLPFSHNNGEGIRKRFGEAAYERWRAGVEADKALTASCKARNAALAAYANQKGTLKDPETTITVKEPGKTPETIIIKSTPKLTLWARFKAWVRGLF